MSKRVKNFDLSALIPMISALIIFGSIGCGGGSDSNGNKSKIEIISSDITLILGKWERTDNGCTETLEFYDDKTFKISSHLEILSGIYELAKKGYTEYYLSMKIESDNGKIDCPGLESGEEAEDDTGSQGIILVSIIDDQLTFKSDSLYLSYYKISSPQNGGSGDSILEEINVTTFDYEMYQSQIGINSDGTRALVAFINKEDLYSIYYNNGIWGSPIKLGEDPIKHSSPYHKLIMNDSGFAVLVNYSDSRVGTEGTFALSYFDGNSWAYTTEIEGVFQYGHIDSSGIAHIIITKQSIEISDQYSFKISLFNGLGYIDCKDIQSDVSGTLHGMIISTNEDNKAMLTYTIYADEYPHNLLGRMILFDGDEWSNVYFWDSKYMSGGILKYHKDGTADFVECGPHILSLCYHKFDGKQWTCVLENNYQMGLDLSVSLNDKGEFMGGYEKPSSSGPYHIESFLYTETGDTVTSIIDNDDHWESAPKRVFEKYILLEKSEKIESDFFYFH